MYFQYIKLFQAMDDTSCDGPFSIWCPSIRLGTRYRSVFPSHISPLWSIPHKNFAHRYRKECLRRLTTKSKATSFTPMGMMISAESLEGST